jgi:hypothetical protein
MAFLKLNAAPFILHAILVCSSRLQLLRADRIHHLSHCGWDDEPQPIRALGMLQSQIIKEKRMDELVDDNMQQPHALPVLGASGNDRTAAAALLLLLLLRVQVLLQRMTLPRTLLQPCGGRS